MKWLCLLYCSALARELDPIKEFHDPAGRAFRLDLATGETTWSTPHEDWLGWSERGDPVADEVRKDLATDLSLRPPEAVPALPRAPCWQAKSLEKVDRQLRSVRDRVWSSRRLAPEAPGASEEQARHRGGDQELLRRGVAMKA